MELNPVFLRESRVRWRGDRAFMLLLLLAGVLSGVIGGAYALNDLGAQSVNAESRLEASGRAIFRLLSLLQLGAWLLIVPALAAPSVAFERERGLLEAMQLSGLAAWRVVLGKFAGIVLFAFLLLCVCVPPLGVCLMLGGVATHEFTGVLALHITTIFCGAALGLYFSSRARRPQQAIRNTFGALLIWLLLTLIGPDLLVVFLNFLANVGVLDESFQRYNGTSNAMMRDVVSAVLQLNPYFLLEGLLADYGRFGGRTIPGRALPAAFDLHTPLLAMLLVGSLLLVLAMRHAKRVLPDAQWVERKRHLTMRGGRLTWAVAADMSAVATARQKSQAKRAVWDVPLVSLLKFRNPVLQREARGLFRLRRFSPLVTALLWMAVALGFVAYAWALMWMLGYPEARLDVWEYAASLALLIVMLAAPLRGANAIARERENGTWETLRLSRLPPREILRGKVLAPLVPLSGALIATSPLWLLSTLMSLLMPTSHYTRGGLSIHLVLGTLALLFATSFVLTSWGLWASWRCRTAGAATGSTMASLIVVMGVFYALLANILWVITAAYHLLATIGYSFFGIPYYPTFSDNLSRFAYRYNQYSVERDWLSRVTFDLQQLLNPWEELQYLLMSARSPGYYYSSYYGDLSGFVPLMWHPFVAALLYIGIGLLILRRLEKRMTRAQILEHENAPRAWPQFLRRFAKRGRSE